MGKLKKSGIDLNRKVLADLAMNHPGSLRRGSQQSKIGEGAQAPFCLCP